MYSKLHLNRMKRKKQSIKHNSNVFITNNWCMFSVCLFIMLDRIYWYNIPFYLFPFYNHFAS